MDKTITGHIRRQLYDRLGIIETPEKVDINELRGSEWSHEFERLQRNRLLMGSLRYGRLGAQGKPQYNRPADIKRRVSLYEESGNLEHLVDSANICMCEFVEGDHPNRHFAAQDDGKHTDIKKG